MNIEEIIEKLNNREATRKELAQQLNMSDSTLSRRIKEAGYTFSNSTKTFSLTSPNPEKQETQEVIKQAIKKEINQENNPSNKEEIQQDIKQEKRQTTKKEKQEVQKTKKTVKKVTYEIDEDLHFELRIEAFKRKTNVSELVEQAIREYLSK